MDGLPYNDRKSSGNILPHPGSSVIMGRILASAGPLMPDTAHLHRSDPRFPVVFFFGLLLAFGHAPVQVRKVLAEVVIVFIRRLPGLVAVIAVRVDRRADPPI